MANETPIEVLARGVCIKQDQLLLCHTKGAENTYLPGGHIEFEESAPISLCREIQEELGQPSRVQRFLGAVEHSYLHKGLRTCEINLVFEVDIPAISVDCSPLSQEDYIEFLWHPMDSLADSRLEPAPLRQQLSVWLNQGKEGTGWATTYS